jgi:hypothetical protein
MKAIATAKGMIAEDDNNQIINAFWLHPTATLVILCPPKRMVYSPAVGRLIQAKKRITPIDGMLQNATSDNVELLRKCLRGELDANADACKPGYRNIKFQVDSARVLAALQTG